MNVLFLSINIMESKRDAITYNFIKKEMEHLTAKGHKVYYLSSLEKDLTEKGVFYLSKDRILEKNTLLRRSYNLIFALRNVFFFKSLMKQNIIRVLHICGIERACIKIIKKFNISIIHTHFFEPDGEGAVLSSKAGKVPIVATLRGAELCAMPELNYGACLDKFYRTALRISAEYIDYFTAPNKLLCGELQTELIIPAEKTEYVPNGVEIIHKKKDRHKINEYIKFISIGSLIKRKNIDLILNTINDLINKFRFEILIIGSGPLREKYERLINELSLKKVSICDEMPKQDLYKLISNCDCIIHPSFFEGMPNVVLESLSIGIPCLVSDIPAHRELIKEGINGFFFDPYSKKNFIYKMQYILENRDILSAMRNDCINSVKIYSIESKIDRYIEIYNNIYTLQKPQ